MIPEGFLPEENVNLLGVADVNQKAADETAERWDVKSYDNVEALLSDPDIEAVYIPVPPFYSTSTFSLFLFFSFSFVCQSVPSLCLKGGRRGQARLWQTQL